MAKRKRWLGKDPSRTKTERQRFMREVKKRFKALADAITKFLVTEDAFGLEPKKPFQLAGTLSLSEQVVVAERCFRDYANARMLEVNEDTLKYIQNQWVNKQPLGILVSDEYVEWLHNEGLVGYNAQKRQYQFLTNPQKVQQFRRWLQQQIDAGVLEVVGGEAGKPWTAPYIESAWRKGMMRAYTDVRKQDLSKSLDWYNGTKEQWLRSAFLQLTMMSSVEMLATRAFEGMKGVTEQMSTQMSRILSDGLVGGYGPKKIAKQMTDAIGKLTRTRALVIARTEIIHAHAEGQLDGLQALGVSEVTAEVEWSTAGDSLVCERCVGMDGKTYTIKEARNMIPLHPNCFVDGQVPIYTSKGWKAIKDIKVGDLVLTHKRRFRKVTELIRTPKSTVEVIRLHVEGRKCGHTRLTLTADHPVRVSGGWVHAGCLSVGSNIRFLAGTCKRCGKKIPWYRTYCSGSCCSRDITDRQWSSEKHRLLISKKARRQMRREYDTGIRDGKEITEAAHRVTREMARQGKCPLSRPDVRELTRKATNKPYHRLASSMRMRLRNPSKIPEVRKRMTESYKRFMQRHPEKHPNVVMAKKGFVSQPEKSMAKILDGLGQKYTRQFPVDRFFTDFALPKRKIVIEVDGEYWHQDKKKDRERQRIIEQQGYTVLRFTDNQLKNQGAVRDELQRVLMNHTGQYQTLAMKVTKIERWKLKKARTLFNFSVDEDESYMAKGFVVHNCRCAWVPATEKKRKGRKRK